MNLVTLLLLYIFIYIKLFEIIINNYSFDNGDNGDNDFINDYDIIVDNITKNKYYVK